MAQNQQRSSSPAAMRHLRLHGCKFFVRRNILTFHQSVLYGSITEPSSTLCYSGVSGSSRHQPTLLPRYMSVAAARLCVPHTDIVCINPECKAHLAYKLPRYLVRKQRHRILQQQQLTGDGLADQVRPRRQRLTDLDEVRTQPNERPPNVPRRSTRRGIALASTSSAVGVGGVVYDGAVGVD